MSLVNPTPFQELVYFSTAILSEVAQGKAYEKHWSDDFALKVAREALEKFQEKAKKVDILSLSKEELFTLGFANWKDSLLLIPLYLLPCLPKGTKVESIAGGKAVLGVDDIDNDVRAGCIAYGIPMKD
jgi:hypothetical protein